MEYVFPPGFRGDEHEAPVDEFAYVLDGEFAVVTKGKGKRRRAARGDRVGAEGEPSTIR